VASETLATVLSDDDDDPRGSRFPRFCRLLTIKKGVLLFVPPRRTHAALDLLEKNASVVDDVGIVVVVVVIIIVCFCFQAER
jgi:hypothetical protein